MAINFSIAIPATTSEQRTFIALRSLKPGSINDGKRALWSVNDGNDVILCTFARTQFTEWKGKVDCLFSKDGVSGYLRKWTIPDAKQVAEVRYGDIDKDGDIDIAVKLTNGAIYVFHNLSK